MLYEQKAKCVHCGKELTEEDVIWDLHVDDNYEETLVPVCKKCYYKEI